MKRLLALLAAALLVVGLFTGCGTTQETTSLPNDECTTAESSDPPADIEETVDVTGDWTFTFEGLFGEETFTLSLADDGTCELSSSNDHVGPWGGTYSADGYTVSVIELTKPGASFGAKPGLWPEWFDADGSGTALLSPEDHTFVLQEIEGAASEEISEETEPASEEPIDNSAQIEAAAALKDSAYRAASLFVCTDRHDPMDGSGNNLTSILSAIAADDNAVQPSVFLFGGDCVGTGPDESENGHPAFSLQDIYSEVGSVYDDAEVYVSFGSHDTAAEEGIDAFLSGPAEEDGYYIYGITYAQMIYATRQQAEEDEYAYADIDAVTGVGAEEGTAAFIEWVDSLDDSRPIIVSSHVPLHVNRADNLGARIWAEALDRAAESHPVIVLFGHNHTTEEYATEATPSLDPPYYLVPAGGSMPIQGEDPDGDYSEPVEIGFTYMNAGYILLGYGSVITFYDTTGDDAFDTISISRYNSDGLSAPFGKTEYISPYVLS